LDEQSQSTSTHGAPRAVTLNQGSVVFAPIAPTSVATPMGKIQIDANSLVLVMVSQQGLAVYDLHDLHRNAVLIETGTHKLHLSPGTQIVITPETTKTFADINPAQAFAYGSISEASLGGGLKSFKSEFSLSDAIRAVMPLRQLVKSTHPNARRIAQQLVKTTAIIASLGTASTPYRQIPRTNNSRVACLTGQ
jgi:hypothetical protein